jgi:phage shock protein C
VRRWNGNPWGPWGGHRWAGNPWNGHRWAGNPWCAGGGAGAFVGRNFRILSGLRRDPVRGKISGVCAGIAGYYDFNVGIIRALMVLAAFINPFMAVGFYVIATFLLRELPDPRDFGGQSEVNAGPSARGEREGSGAETHHARAKREEEDLPLELRIAALKDKFRELETRTGEIEALVTSPEFRLRRDFRQMDEG